MKLVFMTYYVGTHRDVREILESCGIMSYARWAEAMQPILDAALRRADGEG